MEGKKSFIAYCDWLDLIEDLEDAEAGQVLKWLLNYVNDKEPTPPSEKHLKIVCKVIKSQLKEDLEKWKETIEIKREAGRKGGLATQSKNKHNQAEPSTTKQSQANQAVYDNVNVNDSDNVICVNTHNNICACEEAQISNLEGLIRELEQLYGRCLTNMEQAQIDLLSKKYDSKFILAELKDNLDKTNPIAYVSKKLQNKAKVEDDFEENEWLKGFYERNR